MVGEAWKRYKSVQFVITEGTERLRKMWRHKSLGRTLVWSNICKLQQLNAIAFRSFSAGETRFQQVSSEAPQPAGPQGSLPASRPNTRQVQSAGSIYGRLTGIGRNTLKMDVMHFFDGCGLKSEDIKVEYNRSYSPLGMILQFPTRTSYTSAQRLIATKGRFYRLQEVDRGQWNGLASSFDGKVLLLQGIPQNALQEDVERFFSGCNIDGASIRFFMRQGSEEPVRLALVGFRTNLEAMHALREKNRSFCLNNPISLRLLQ